MRRAVKQFLIFTILIAILLLPYFVFAQEQPKKDTMKSMLEGTGQYGGYDTNTRETTISIFVEKIIEAFLGLLGVIFIILIIVAGFNWMTASGDEEKVRKAKETIRRAIIGLLIVVAAYSITYFVFSNIQMGGGAPVTAD